MRYPVILAVIGLAVATPASSQSIFKKLEDRVSERVANAVTNGQLPNLPSGSSKASTAGFERYGAWDLKLERLERGTDDAWQVVIGVRNAANYRQGMVASELNVFLITEDGETVPSWGELYKASVEGSAAGLEPLPGTLWLEPGDVSRVRLRFDGSRGMKPAKMRIQSTGATSQSRTFPVAG